MFEAAMQITRNHPDDCEVTTLLASSVFFTPTHFKLFHVRNYMQWLDMGHVN